MMAPIDTYAAFLEGLTPDNLSTLPDYVTRGVRFVDPFNDVTGVDHMTRIFSAMFAEVGPVKFSVNDAHGDTAAGMLAWRFEAQLRHQLWAFNGASVLRFAADGRVREHIDHWDAAGSLYERLPAIGWLLGVLRRRLATR